MSSHVDFNETKLGNGLTVVLQPMTNGNGKVNVTFVFDGVGASADTKPGVAHLTEHMVFRGNEKDSAKAVADKITYLSGGAYTAYTAYDKTVFSLDTYKNSLNDAVELLVDMFSKSTLNNFDTEKNVIRHELNMRLDNPYINLFNLIDRAHDIVNDDLLQKQTLPSISQQDIQTFIQENYVPSKCKLVISGEMDDLDIVEAVIKSKTKAWQNVNSPAKELKSLDYKPGYFAQKGNTECAYFSLFFRGAKIGDIKDVVNECIVNAVAGHGLNSIMMYDARLNQGLTYGIESISLMEKDHGVWGVASATDKESLPALVKSAMTSVKSIRYSIDDPKNNNVDMAKISLKNSLNQPIFTPAGKTFDYMMYNSLGVTKDELVKIIDETTTKDVLGWFDKTLSSGPSLALYGDVETNAYSQEAIGLLWNSIGTVA